MAPRTPYVFTGTKLPPGGSFNDAAVSSAPASLLSGECVHPMPPSLFCLPLPPDSGAWVQVPRSVGVTDGMWRLRVNRAVYQEAFTLAQTLLGSSADGPSLVVRGVVLRHLLAPHHVTLAALTHSIGGDRVAVSVTREAAEALLATSPDDAPTLAAHVAAWTKRAAEAP